MKNKLIVALSGATFAVPLMGVTLSATLDNLGQWPGKTITEGGLTFASPSDLVPLTGSVYNQVFGWGGSPSSSGSAILSSNYGWLTVSAGQVLSSLTFTLGSDWNQYYIATGQIHVNLGWEAYLGGQLVSASSLPTPGNGGNSVTLTPGSFDSIKLRSFANEYSNSNKIAIDNVLAVTAQQSRAATFSVPDHGPFLPLVVLVLGLMFATASVTRKLT